MKIFKNLSLLILSSIVSYFLVEQFFKLYNYFWPVGNPSGLFAGYAMLGNVMIGFFVAFTFFPPLLFTAFGDKKKYWWVGVLLLPVAWFIIKFDLTHWYFYLALAVAGWLVGWLNL